MSIHNFLNKIKAINTIDNTHFMYFYIVFFVGLASFGLGRLSVDKSSVGEDSILILNTEQNPDTALSLGNDDSSTNSNVAFNMQYVASKNGKLYYTPDCSGAKRLKPENQIWFKSSQDAEKSGYTFSTSCEK